MSNTPPPGYVVRPSCNICAHGVFVSIRQWGNCRLAKSRVGQRDQSVVPDPSVHRCGYCPAFALNPARLATYNAHAQLYAGPSEKK